MRVADRAGQSGRQSRVVDGCELRAAGHALLSQLSLRAVANELAARGFVNERGKVYAAKTVASMLR